MHAEGTMFMKNYPLSAAICFTFVLALNVDLSQNLDSVESCRFEIHTSSLTWNKAREACQQRDMTLVSLSDTEEVKYLSTLVKEADTMYSNQYALENRNYWVGLWKGGTEYYWADCILSSGEADIFPDKTKYADPSGCGFIKEGASVDMTQCDVRKGFICEHTNGRDACYTTLSTTIIPMGYDKTTNLAYSQCTNTCLDIVSCAGVYVTAQDYCLLLSYTTGLAYSLQDTQIQSTYFYHRRRLYNSTYLAFTTYDNICSSSTPSVIDTTRIEEKTMGEGINPTTSLKPTSDPPNTANEVLEGTYNNSSTINDSLTTESTTDDTNSHSVTEGSGTQNDHVATNYVTSNQSNTEGSGSLNDHLTTNGINSEGSGSSNEHVTTTSIYDETNNHGNTEGNGSLDDHVTTNSIYDVTNNQTETEGSGDHHTYSNEISTLNNNFFASNNPDETISVVTPNEHLSTSFDVTTSTCIDNDRVTPSSISDATSTVDDHFSLSISTYSLSSLISNNIVEDIQVSNYSISIPTEQASTENLSEGTNTIHAQVTIYSSYGIGTYIDQTNSVNDGTNSFTYQVTTTSSYDTTTLSSTSGMAIVSSGVTSKLYNQASMEITSANSVTIPILSVGGSDQVTTDTSVVEITTLSIQDTTDDTSTDHSIGNPPHGTSAQFIYSLENSTLCECICRVSDETQEEKLQRITTELAMNKRSLSRTVRKRVSASDPRPSARYVGYVGVAIIFIFVGTIVSFDIPRFVVFVRGLHDTYKQKTEAV